jgi:hypothetical protein
MENIAGWVAPIATMGAAMMTAANIGTRVTGWGFIVFTVGSIAWSIVAIATGQQNLLWTNGFLTLVNLVGVWRWLGRQARYDDGGEKAADRSAMIAHAPTLFPIGSLIGAQMQGRDGTPIGTVIDAMMRCADTGLDYIVVSEGGVGGVGERLHALGKHEIAMSDGGIRCCLSIEQLRRRPVIQAGAWPASFEPPIE